MKRLTLTTLVFLLCVPHQRVAGMKLVTSTLSNMALKGDIDVIKADDEEEHKKEGLVAAASE